MPRSQLPRKLRVFVSSTSEDLRDYRAVARLAILDMDWMPVMMEHFGSIPVPTVEACYEKLRDCDLMVLLIAFRRGWVPTVEQGGNGRDSITALELNHARAHDIPVVAMLASETWPGNLWEHEQEARSWIKAFRAGLNLPAGFFDYETPSAEESKRFPAFRARLMAALVQCHEHLLRQEREETSPEPPDGLELLESASEVVRSGACIPFLGGGIHGSGPLSPRALVQALGEIAPHEPSLATVAEYRQHHLRSRAAFLNRLAKIIEDQTKQAAVPAVHELLLKLEPPLIVSTTPDLLLEERLEREGRHPLILCHVLRSHNNEYDGKVLVFRGPDDASPELSPADEIDLSTSRDNTIIYKPLGSPLLHRRLDPELQLDTVVITESDHLTFLGRLENLSTGVPTAFSLDFQQYPFIFLGYPMDIWHYRLVVRLFQSLCAVGRGPTSLAVWVPTSSLEERAWRWLGVDLVRMEPNDFARKVLEP